MMRYLKFGFILAILAATLLSCFGVANADSLVRHRAATRTRATTIVRASGSTVNWPQLGFDSGHSAYNPNETIIGPNNVGTLQQAWSFPTGTDNDAGNVIEANEVVYAPSTNGTLFAINATTGQQVWSFASGSGYASGGSAPAYDNGMLFTVCNTASGTQGICALNASTGSPIWEYTLPLSGAYAGTAPVVSGGSLYFEGCGATGCYYVALSEQAGSVKWIAQEPQGSCAGNGGVTPAVAYRLLYVNPICPTGAASLLGIRVEGGKTKWGTLSDPPGGLSVAFGIVAQENQTLFPSSEQYLEAWDAKTGEYIWSDNGGAWSTPDVPSMPAITKRFVYIVHNNYITALTTKKGHIQHESFPNTASTSWPSVANGVVYTACPGRPCAFDATTLGTLWQGPTSGTPTFGVPIVVNGVVYGVCNGTNVCAWTLPSMIRRFHQREVRAQ